MGRRAVQSRAKAKQQKHTFSIFTIFIPDKSRDEATLSLWQQMSDFMELCKQSPSVTWDRGLQSSGHKPRPRSCLQHHHGVFQHSCSSPTRRKKETEEMMKRQTNKCLNDRKIERSMQNMKREDFPRRLLSHHHPNPFSHISIKAD